MIIVDNALKQREEQNDPVRVGIIGAGFVGRGMVLTIERSIPGMKVAALYNRTISKAEQAFQQADIYNYKKAETREELDQLIHGKEYAITDNALIICQAENIDVVIEATGEIEFGLQVILNAINNKKHIVLMNADIDATVGSLLKKYADDNGVIITNADGDQPGVIMNLFRFVKTIGYKPVLAGNIKGLQDHYRTPETQAGFARKYKQNPKIITSFADGTKISMEMAVVANATGFKVTRRGMYGPECKHVSEALDLFTGNELTAGGIVDYILGAEPGPGVFVIGYNEHPVQQEYMKYLKMGTGPYYLFYVPYHLPHLEAPLTAARAVLFNDATITPAGEPVCEVITIAKKDLKKGESLDGIGGYTCYGTIENTDIARKENLLPMGLSRDCVLLKNIQKDQAIRQDYVHIPPERMIDRFWNEQQAYFS